MKIKRLIFYMFSLIFMFEVYATDPNCALSFKGCSIRVDYNFCGSELFDSIKVTALNSSVFSHNGFKAAKLNLFVFINSKGEIELIDKYSDLKHPYSRESVKIIKGIVAENKIVDSCMEFNLIFF